MSFIFTNITSKIQYSILLAVVFMALQESAWAQNSNTQPNENTKPTTKAVKDTVVRQYGIRFGVDIVRPIMAQFKEGYDNGFQVMLDGRVHKDLFVAGEIGYHKRSTDFTAVSSDIDGFFLKAGVDYNFMKGLRKRNDTFYAGARLGYSNFDQRIYNYQVDNDYWGDPELADLPSERVNATWMEILFGLKVEVLKNFYMGMTVRYGIMFSAKDRVNDIKSPDVPGFGEVFSGRGFNFDYGLFYMIPTKRK